MTLNLAKFLVIWLSIIFIFSALTTLLDYERFPMIGQAFVYFLKASMGDYDYDDFDSDGLLLVFLFVNVVIMLNFIVAILASTYERYESNSHGYYYTMILGIIPTMEYHESYGAIVCATQPLDLILLFICLPMFIVPDASKPKFNKLASTILYIPIAFCLSLFFIVTNTLMSPVAYFVHTGRILWSIPFQDTPVLQINMIAKALDFFIAGGMYMWALAFIDPAKFMLNLFTKPD